MLRRVGNDGGDGDRPEGEEYGFEGWGGDNLSSLTPNGSPCLPSPTPWVSPTQPPELKKRYSYSRARGNREKKKSKKAGEAKT